VGCGEGHNTRLLAQQGAKVVAFDLAEAFLAAAVAMNREGISYLHADGARMPFQDATFDAVTAFMTLHDTATVTSVNWRSNVADQLADERFMASAPSRMTGRVCLW